jgi:nucleoside-diphosphate-sugar epimerase
MRVLVTGGTGFIGSHLCEFLLEQGAEVLCLDNLSTGASDNIDRLRSERFSFIKHDVTNYIYVAGPVDYVLHFASPASPVDYQLLPIPTLKVGALGTHKTLGLAKAKEARFLLASTSEVYGDPLVHPQREDYWGNVNPVGPAAHGLARLAVRRLGAHYHLPAPPPTLSRTTPTRVRPAAPAVTTARRPGDQMSHSGPEVTLPGPSTVASSVHAGEPRGAPS